MPATTRIKCVYFKESGKYYSEFCEEFDSSLFEGCIYPSDYGRLLLRRRMLPGLEGGVWDGFFTVQVIGSYTELVVPQALKARNPIFPATAARGGWASSFKP